jgi:hypothetical protein
MYITTNLHGIHKVEKWDPDEGEYLLNLDGQKFWSNPFRIFIKFIKKWNIYHVNCAL